LQPLLASREFLQRRHACSRGVGRSLSAHSLHRELAVELVQYRLRCVV
jgi:hypothetical protein